MSGAFFALLDDISILMDDVATMTKVATEKTAGLLGDDLAVNAEKSSGFLTSRELPALWKITKGALFNKIIILPIAFLISAFVPIVITGILICGGFYLAYEGAHKIYEYLFHRNKKKAAEIVEQNPSEIASQEDERVKSAIFVDFILSIEIVIIALSTVQDSELKVQIIVVSLIALIATIGVYGIVALIVRMDDVGYRLIKENSKGFKRSLGTGLVKALPIVIKALGIIGTIALVLVAGGIFAHNTHQVHDFFHAWPSTLIDAVVGLVVGFVVFGLVSAFKKVKSTMTSA
jgi:predicted DNA repair protein MutK